MVSNSGNVTANIIHDAVYDARPDVKAVVHLHTPAAVAVSCLEQGVDPIPIFLTFVLPHCPRLVSSSVECSRLAAGFLCLDQNSSQFFGDMVAYHEYEGLSTDLDEQAQIARDIGDKACVLLMR